VSERTNGIKIIPLGGFGQIGANCLTIEIAGSIIIIDCGVIFPEEPSSGVDIYHPPFDYLKSRKDDIIALIITHGHEDHVGAIPFLLQTINIPVYAHPFTLKSIAARIKEYNLNIPATFIPFKPDIKFSAGDFNIIPFSMPHSIEANHGFYIENRGFRILHTGDYKLDIYAGSTAADMLNKLSSFSPSDKPVNLLITDSTGALTNKDAGSESAVKQGMKPVLDFAAGRVFVVLFSSNSFRLQTMGELAKFYGRKLVLSGKSLINNFQRCSSDGYCDPFSDILISEKDAYKYDDSNLLVLLSGTQGEKRSALGRIAFSNHSRFTVNQNDTFVFSSRFIPGNELRISHAVNALLEKGAAVFHQSNTENIHVSGHGSINEITSVISAVSPISVLPAHGTFEHMNAVAGAALNMGINQTLVVRNGEIVFAGDAGIKKMSGTVPSQKTARADGTVIDLKIIKERHKIGTKGFIHVSVQFFQGVINDSGDIQIASCGLFKDDQVEEHATSILKEQLINVLGGKTQLDINTVSSSQNSIKATVRRVLKKNYGQNPVISVNIRY
jgi:ribonuclease J